ncbi:MAG: LamG-like jellyroll fold domain-containing protein [Solirubrobacteraceae bacterium]
MVTEQFLIAIPLIILASVVLLAFAGCGELLPSDEPGPNYQATIAAETSLVSYWRLGESSGTVANDAKGAHPGEYQGGVTLGVPGLIDADADTAVSFDGTSGQVRVPPPPAAVAGDLNPSNFSVEAWVKLQEAPGTARAIVSSIDAQAHTGYAIVAGSGSWEAWVGDGSNWQKLPSAVPIHQDQRAYLLLAFDGSKLIFGVDGGPLSEAPAPNFKPNLTKPLVIGGPGPDGAGHFHGVIDEVAVYNEALSQGQATGHWGANGHGSTLERPTAVTGDATAITATQATLTGSVNPKGQATNYHFDHGETDTYGSSTSDSSAGAGTTDQAASATITGLSPKTTYHYRITAHSSAGDGSGSDHQFTTPPSTKYQTAVKIPELLSYWRLGETLGAWAFDSAPAKQYRGDYVGGCKLDQDGALIGDPDRAVEFNGTDAEMASTMGPVLSGACSIEGWFKWAGGRALLTDDAGGGGGWRIAFELNGKLAYRFAGTTFDTGKLINQVRNNAWHHFVATKDAAGNVAFYLDGQSIHTGAGAGNTAAQMPWHLMRDRPSGEFAAGTADEVAMYGVALPASTVLDHFNFASG